MERKVNNVHQPIVAAGNISILAWNKQIPFREVANTKIPSSLPNYRGFFSGRMW
jgi:hypothetical protein